MRHDMNEANPRFSFGGHETFPFRYGWLKKGVDNLRKDPCLFRRNDALVTLGVGKNMVRSIRSWCLATQLANEELIDTQSRSRGLKLTPLGQRLFDDSGWDPYLEDPASLWLLHWKLVSNGSRATVWHLCFTHYFEIDFTKEKLFSFVSDKLQKHSINISRNTIERDIDCFIRTYVYRHATSDQAIEEQIHCPLAELSLIKLMPDNRTYSFNIGSKTSLPAAIVGFAILDFAENNFNKRQTIPLEDCLYLPGSPGQAFKLDEYTMTEYLEELQNLTSGSIRLDETAGLKQLYKDSSVSAWSLLNQYYS